MKKLTITAVLTFALSVTAFGGEIPTIGAHQPAQATSTEPGDIPTVGVPTPVTEPGDIPSDGSPGDIPSAGMSVLLEVLGFLV